MKIFVKIARIGKIVVFPLEVNSSDSIHNVKLMIMETKEIPRNKQVLIFNGKQLDDNFTLAECGIQNESTLHLMMCVLDFKSAEGVAEYLKMLTDIPLTDMEDEETTFQLMGGSDVFCNCYGGFFILSLLQETDGSLRNGRIYD